MKWAKQIALHYIRTQLKLLGKISKKKAARRAFDLFTTPQSRVTKVPTPIIQKAEVLRFVFKRTAIRGYRWNHPSDKKVLILHGYESSAVNFEKYVNPLIEKGFEVLAFDAPAHGLSGGKRINALEYSHFIQEIIKEYGPVTNFITHSFGGLAICLALEELPHDDSWRVALIAPATETTTAMKHLFKLLKLDAAAQGEFVKFIKRAGNQPPEWFSVSRACAYIKAQVLFLQDRKDYITPLSDVQPIIEMQYPNFRFEISEGLGHSKIYRDPTTIKKVVDFL